MSGAVNKLEDIPRMYTKDVCVYYGDKQAIQNTSLDFFDSEVTALIGPSGCGKSTYLRCLNRMNDFIESCRVTGEVNIDDQNIYAPEVDPVLVRRRVGMVFQKPNPFPKSITENITWGPKRAKFKKSELPQIVEESLKKAALWDEVKDRLDSSAYGLSGGQQQRLCIARAIAMRPSVLLMDEPCSALDPIATAKIEELIAELRKDFTIVIVTHNMQQARRVSDKTAFFMLGRLVECAETTQLFNSPIEAETENYLTGKFG